MAFKLWDWLRGATGSAKKQEVTVRELYAAGDEYRLRELAFWSCVNLVGNALARCEFRTYLNGEETFGPEHYLLNVSPNARQNSTAFFHQLAAQLFQDNEVLILSTRKRDGSDQLIIADSWNVPDPQWNHGDVYENITVRDSTLYKTFREKDVIHLTLNHVNLKPVINGVYQAYVRLLQAAMNNYAWGAGQHWKVHVSQMASGEAGWADSFREMIEAQVKPFLNAQSAVLPELDGYEYSRLNGDYTSKSDHADILNLTQTIFDLTARAFLIPPALISGQAADTHDALNRFLTNCVDPVADQLSEELTRKRYGYDNWKRGSKILADTSSIAHIDLVSNAANVEKLIGSGFSMNDVRRALGQPSINEDWANKHVITKNFASVETLTSERDDTA